MEDWSHRNNLQVQGIPEGAAAENLGDAVPDIFRSVLDDPEVEIEVDRVHRAPGPRPANTTRPQDVVCRLHQYVQKENILRRAWEHDDVEVEGAQVRILPDLSRAMLRCGATLRPVLDLAKQLGFTYRWGYPLSVTFRKDETAFTLQSTTDLPALFRYLETDPIAVPDWLQILLQVMGRSGISTLRGPLPPRQQRGRRRPQNASGGEPCE